jgi:hypothetical protein
LTPCSVSRAVLLSGRTADFPDFAVSLLKVTVFSSKLISFH